VIDIAHHVDLNNTLGMEMSWFIDCGCWDWWRYEFYLRCL